MCSCGTQLVEGAVFCHRCGKPTRELVPQEETVEEAVPVVAEVVPPASGALPKTVPVSFHNIVAVRIGLLVASVASMLDALPFIDMLFVVWSAAAGFAAVWLYRRSTGQVLSVRSGARMGWITGVLNSVIVMVLLTLTFAASSTDITASMRQQLTATVNQDPAKFAKAMPFIQSPYVIAICILVGLAFIFLVFTAACVAGGALGAHFTRKDSPPA